MSTSQWLTNTLASIEKLFISKPIDQATKDAVAELKTQMAANNVTNADQTAAFDALVAKLAASEAA